MPLLSVILNAHDAGDLLTRSLASVLSQDCDDLECIIVDDASEIPLVASAYTDDARVRVVRLDENVGIGMARNIGITEATSDYVAFLDHDDAWAPSKLRLQFDALRAEPDSWFSYTGYIWHFPNGTELLSPGDDVTYHGLLADQMIHMSSVVVRRDAYLAVGGSDPTLVWAQDHDLLLRLLHRGPKPVAVRECLSHYYLHNANRSSRYRQSVGFRRLVIRMHAERARALDDDETLAACARGMRRADELLAAQALDAARRHRRAGTHVLMLADLGQVLRGRVGARARGLASAARTRLRGGGGADQP